MEEAKSARTESRFADAAKHYAQALDGDPTNLVALRGLVELHARLGRLSELEPRFSEAIRKNPNDAWAHEGLGLVWFALAAEKGDAARHELELAAKLAPEVADFHYRLGVLLVESDDFPAAREALEKAIELDPARARYRLPYALSLARTGDRPAAVKELETVLTLSPSLDEVQIAEKTAHALTDPFRGFPLAAREQYERALTWLQGDALAQARQVLEALIEQFPDLAVVHATYGLCALRMDDMGRAIAEFRRAIELDPELAEARLYLGNIYFARGRPDTAKEYFDAAVARNPYLPEAQLKLAEVAMTEKNWDLAADRYKTYLLLRPNDFNAHAARVKILDDLRRPEAAQAWDELAAQFPSQTEALVGRGKFYFTRAAQATTMKERIAAKDKARESLERAVELDEENATAAALLGQLGRL